MKKQFLSLAIFLLAVFAGINESNAQGVKWSTPQTLSCTSDALHPFAGVQYTYKAEVSDLTGTGEWRFWATNDSSFVVNNAGEPEFNTATALIVGSNELLTASANYNIEVGVGNSNVNTEGTIQLTWTSGMLNSVIAGTEEKLFVVAYYVSGSECTDNMKIWELDPQNAFTVDIIAMDVATPESSIDKYNVTPTTCVDVVESIKYESGKGIVYDYGDNYLYFEFVAANFTDYWIPEFTVTGENSAQTLTYQYTYDTPDTWGSSTNWTTLESGKTHITPATSVKDATDKGVSVFVRVLVDHANYENKNGQTFTMTLDGKLADGTYDVVNADCSDPGAADKADTADSKIDPRPTVTDTSMPAPKFTTGNETN
ncbi:hypothetical protein [Mangrovibacterium lignilyticum]|uniref:hypothetical protein n=1 Tax=Mangrovibacterium lignilyticum TaxID=2668052 RepID=UPI0013D7D01F|nr:hypothetical protein [Mangrovibacterium lignilyticum]